MKPPKRRWAIALAVSGAILGALAAVGTIPDLNGTWVMLQVYPRIAQLPLVGESTQTSYVVQFVDIEQDDTTVLMQDRYCFTIIEESSTLAKTVIPDEFMASLRPTPREARLREVEGEIFFEQAPYIEIRGALLDNPETEELPASSDDPRVFDQDGDGFPGMTVNVNLLGFLPAKIFVVQRVQYVLEGTVTTSDRIEGLIRWADEQIVLAATNQLLMAGSESEPDPDPSQHVFLMLRAEDGWTCAWLREHWREVFGVEKSDATES